MKRISGGQLSLGANPTLLLGHAEGPRAATGDTTFEGQANTADKQSQSQPAASPRTNTSGRTSPPKPHKTMTVTAVSLAWTTPATPRRGPGVAQSVPGAVARQARRALPGGCCFPRSRELVEAVEIYAPEREHVGDDIVTAMDPSSRARVLVAAGGWDLVPAVWCRRPRSPPRLRGRTRSCLRVRRGRRRGGTRPPRRVQH